MGQHLLAHRTHQQADEPAHATDRASMAEREHGGCIGLF
jgi:hypothetical protein